MEGEGKGSGQERGRDGIQGRTQDTGRGGIA